jgi:uncharacterized membrane protein
MNYDVHNLFGDRLITRLTQESIMDYSELVIRMNQRLREYNEAANKKDLAAAKTIAAVLLELADELLFVTRGMK